MAHSAVDRRIGDFVTVQVDYRQHRAGFGRIKEFVTMPCCGCRTCLSLSIANNTGYNEVRIIHRSTKGSSQRIAQLAAFMDRPRYARVEMAGETARPGETPDELVQPGTVKRQLGVIFLQGAFEVQVRQVRWRSMPWARDQEHVEIMAHNQSIEVSVDQVDTGTRAPVTQ